MKLQTCYVDKKERMVYLTTQDGHEQKCYTDNKFYPSYWQECDLGDEEAFSYFNDPVKRIYLNNCFDMKKIGKRKTFESDVELHYQYILDHVKDFEDSTPRWCFLDIETLVRNPHNLIPCKETADYDMISAVTLYDSVVGDYTNFFLGDIIGEYGDVSDVDIQILENGERKLFNSLVKYFKERRFNLLMSWFLDFDMGYLQDRAMTKYMVDFSKAISPFNKTQWGYNYNKPVGIAYVDMLNLYRKYTMNQNQSYSLDYTLEHETGKGKVHNKVDFRTLNKDVNLRNIDDVKDVVEKIEKKYDLIQFFNQMRLRGKLLWEDVGGLTINFEYHSRNSVLINNLLLIEARKQGIVLPNKGVMQSVGNDALRKELADETDPIKRKKLKSKIKYGAFREIYKRGVYSDVHIVDLSSAYPLAILDLNLSAANFRKMPEPNTIAFPLYSREDDGDNEYLDTLYFKQNPDDIFVKTVRDSLQEKEDLKQLIANTSPSDSNFNLLKVKYALIKSVINSIYGVASMGACRVADIRVTNSVTCNIRSIFYYILGKCDKDILNRTVKEILGLDGDFYFDSIFIDTDSFAVQSNIPQLEHFLNKLILKYSNEQFGKDFALKFDYEGCFKYILNLAKCRYRAILQTKKGLEVKSKGLQTKRSDSSTFQKKYMDVLLNYCMLGVEITTNELKDVIKRGEFDKLNIQPPSKDLVFAWVDKKKKEFGDPNIYPIETIAQPKKIRKTEYSSVQIAQRAVELSNELIGFKPELNELFYIAYIKPVGYEQIEKVNYYTQNRTKVSVRQLRPYLTDIGYKSETPIDDKIKQALLTYCLKNGIITEDRTFINGKAKNVIAFNVHNCDAIFAKVDIDYNRMIELNFNCINNAIFTAMDWVNTDDNIDDIIADKEVEEIE